MFMLTKIAVGAAGSAVNFFTWLMTMIYGYGCIAYIYSSVVAVDRFNHSRGSLFDLLSFQTAVANPLQGQSMDPGLLNIVIFLAAGFALLILTRTILMPTIRESLILNFKTMSGGLAGVTLTYGLLVFMAGGGLSDMAIVLSVCIPLVVVLQVAATLLAQSLARESQAVVQPTMTGGLAS